MSGSLSVLVHCSAAHGLEPPERKGSQARQDSRHKGSALAVVPHVGQPRRRLPGEESGGLGSRGRHRPRGGSTCRLLSRGRCRPGSRSRCRLLGRGCRLGGRDGGVHQDRVDGGRDAIDHVACGTIKSER